MRGAVYDKCMTTGHGTWPPTPVNATQSKVFIQGKPAIVRGDPITPHTNNVPKTHGGSVITSTSKIFVQGVPLALIGDSISCGDTISQSSSKVTGK